MKHVSFKLEKELLKRGYRLIIGIDEAGRGPLAGPVVAAAALLKCHPELVSGSQKMLKQVQHDKIMLIRDSKALSENQREKIFDFVQDNFFVGVGICDYKTIDRINILEATFLAMKKAVNDLSRNVERETHNAPRSTLHAMRKILLVDGNKKIPNFSMEQRAIINGDKTVKSISAASIVAKVTRDRIMRKMHKKYPIFRFDRHKGYGTKFHIEMLKKHGYCQIHRQSFEPVKNLVKMGK